MREGAISLQHLSPGGLENYTRMSDEGGGDFTAAFITRAREEVPLLCSNIYTKLEDREVGGAVPPFPSGGGRRLVRLTPA